MKSLLTRHPERGAIHSGNRETRNARKETPARRQRWSRFALVRNCIGRRRPGWNERPEEGNTHTSRKRLLAPWIPRLPRRGRGCSCRRGPPPSSLAALAIVLAVTRGDLRAAPSLSHLRLERRQTRIDLGATRTRRAVAIGSLTIRAVFGTARLHDLTSAPPFFRSPPYAGERARPMTRSGWTSSPLQALIMSLRPTLVSPRRANLPRSEAMGHGTIRSMSRNKFRHF